MIFKNEASEILRKDPRADMKEDREKALADDCWLGVER